jgi:hypothetical protein
VFRPLVVLSGFVALASVSLWAQLAEAGAQRAVWVVAVRAVIAGFVGAALLPAARWVVLRVAALAPVSPATRARYARWEQWTYAIFALTVFTAFGLQLIMPVLLGIAGLFLIAQLALLRPSWEGRAPESFAVGVLFLLSGAAALMYQVVWQRLLFGAVGVNIEAVTLIVAIFMLGLGLGSLAGGRLSLLFPDQLAAVFAALELGIAAFGAVSIPLISIAGRLAGAASLPAVAATLMLLLLVPTLLMGATLPVLVAHVNRTFADVGRSVGTLYFVNTLGSAIASLAVVLVLFAFVGLRTTVYLAVAINVTVAVLVGTSVIRPRRTA